MPRNARCVKAGLPYHVTQRGTNRQRVFFSASDRRTYLDLMMSNLEDAEVRVFSWCLMTNHVHFVVVPEREDSMEVLFRRVHGRYAQSLNARRGRSGHLWQNRYYSCALSETHMWRALAYVVRIPAKPITDSNLMAIRIPIHTDHYRSEATRACFMMRK